MDNENISTFSVIINREISPVIPEDKWYHLVPIGKIPGFMEENGKSIRVIQDIDSAVIAELANNFRGKPLVDFDHHSSLPDGDTTAAAWLTKVEERPDGLWGLFDFSDLGKLSVENKRYRFLSPSLLFDVKNVKEGDLVRPVALGSVGLTNRPNMKTLTPLSNKESVNKQSPEALMAQGEKGKQMKEIITALGLPDNAEMPVVLNAIGALQNQAKELPTVHHALSVVKNQLAAMQKKELESEVEKDLVKFAPVIQNREEVKAQLIANREATLKILAALKTVTPEKEKTVHNRAGAKTPDGTATVRNKAADQAAFIATVKNRDKVDHKTAFNTARAEKPELFQEEAKEE